MDIKIFTDMKFLGDMNVLVSIIAGCMTIVTTISGLSKSRSIQYKLENSSIPAITRISIESQWSGFGLLAKILNGIILGGLQAVVTTVSIIFIINLFFFFRDNIHYIHLCTSNPNFNVNLDFKQILSLHYKDTSVTLGAIIGCLTGISRGISTVTKVSERP